MPSKFINIKDRKTFLAAKCRTLIEIAKDCVERDLGLWELDNSIYEWIEAWTELDDNSWRAIEEYDLKNESENLSFDIDEFIGQLVDLRFSHKTRMVKRYEDKAKKLEKELSNFKKGFIDEI